MRKIVGGRFVLFDDFIEAQGRPTQDATCGFVHGDSMFSVADEQVGAVTYEPEGSVQTGAFRPIESVREGERQRHFKEGTW